MFLSQAVFEQQKNISIFVNNKQKNDVQLKTSLSYYSLQGIIILSSNQLLSVLMLEGLIRTM